MGTLNFAAITVLAHAAAVIEREGCYVSARSVENTWRQSTGSQVKDALVSDNEDETFLIITEEHRTTARQVLNYFSQLAMRDGVSEYEQKIALLLHDGVIGWMNVPLIASAVATYQRETARQSERDRWSSSRFVGRPEEKLPLFCATVESRRQFDGEWGLQWIYTLVDDAGNVFTWWSKQDALIGERYELRGAKVKRHEVYGDIERTTVGGRITLRTAGPRPIAGLLAAPTTRRRATEDYSIDELFAPTGA